MEIENKKFYQKAWFAWVMLFLLAPVGIILLWKYKHHGKMARSIISVIFGIAWAAAVVSGGEENENVVKEEPVETMTTEEESEPIADTPEPVDEPEPIEEEEEKEELAKEEEKSDENVISSGTHIVGEDIEPGVYQGLGVSYWARLSGLGGSLDEIIANETPVGPTYVEIKESDEAFETMGGQWIKIDLDEYEEEESDEIGPGMYLVGKDIQPGRYKTADDSGYWARLKGLSGELDDIIANDNMAGGGYVEISGSDVAFYTTMHWEKAD